MNAPKPPLVVFAGPTASGKSALALALADAANGTVINADASQVYADLRVLTARPSLADEARAPHRLYGVIDGDLACSAAMWAGMARAAIAEVQAEGRLPILTGGTGLYLRTLLDGIAPVPPVPDELREAVRALPPAEAWEALTAEDPGAAAKLNPGDRQRVARALEVVRATGRPLAAWQAEPASGGLASDVALHAFVVEVERGTLYRRCDARFGAMIEDGAVAEVLELRSRELPDDRPVMKALGVPPLVRHIAGELTLDEAAEIARRDTRHYAKRQSTWFRNQNPLWNRIHISKDAKGTVERVIKLLN